MLRLNIPGDFGLEDASFPPWSPADGQSRFQDARRPLNGDRGFWVRGILLNWNPGSQERLDFTKLFALYHKIFSPR